MPECPGYVWKASSPAGTWFAAGAIHQGERQDRYVLTTDARPGLPSVKSRRVPADKYAAELPRAGGTALRIV